MQASSHVQALLDAIYERYQHDLDALIDSAASHLANEYYSQTRQIWQTAGVDLPDFEHARLIEPERALWQVQGGFSHTDFNGLTYKQVMEGQARSGVRVLDLLPDIANIDTAQQLVADMMQASARLTTQRNMRMDPVSPRWARVPKGETCEFCLMLASRGWVYLSEESAKLGGTVTGSTRVKSQRFHLPTSTLKQRF